MTEMVEVPREYLERLERQDRYLEKFDASEEYQDFVVDQLLGLGIAVNQYSSKKYQREVGESASGIEVKYDMLLAKTGNVFIEVDEKKDPSGGEFAPSGIYRDDGSRFYLIGNYEKAILLSKRQMRMFLEQPVEKLNGLGIHLRLNKFGTSHGWTVGFDKLAESFYCLMLFEFREGGQTQWQQ